MQRRHYHGAGNTHCLGLLSGLLGRAKSVLGGIGRHAAAGLLQLGSRFQVLLCQGEREGGTLFVYRWFQMSSSCQTFLFFIPLFLLNFAPKGSKVAGSYWNYLRFHFFLFKINPDSPCKVSFLFVI
jgi:hypothetical protein